MNYLCMYHSADVARPIPITMKYFGSIMDFTQQRNNDLLSTYRRCIEEADYIVKPDIFQKVADSPASRFWVSEERAAIVVSAMLAGRSPKFPPTRRLKREMFEEIYRRFLQERKDAPDESVYELVARVINQPAPKFYLTARTVGELIYRIGNGWYDRQHDRYRNGVGLLTKGHCKNTDGESSCQ